MPLAFYFDHNIWRAIEDGARWRGLDVLTARQDDMHAEPDIRLLERALELGKLLFTMDDDFLRLAAYCRHEKVPFGGIVYAHQRKAEVGLIVDDLVLIAETSTYSELAGQVIYLPI